MPYPLISCIMPTRNRRQYIPAAVRSFQEQTYPNRQLVVVDNSDEPIKDLIPGFGHYTYQHVGPEWLTTGAMRNKACELADGKLIAHWDDDDYSHPQRLMEQYRHMQSMCVSVVGYNQMYFLDEELGQAWLYTNPDLYALGTSLLYTRDYWKGHKFQNLLVAEDGKFIEPAQDRRAMACKAAGTRLIARIHSTNTSEKRPWIGSAGIRNWQSVPYEQVKGMIP